MTDCEFCASALEDGEPTGLEFIRHVEARDDCRQQFEHLLENIRTSWTASMSGP